MQKFAHGLLGVLAGLCLCVSAGATTTVTGHIADLGTGSLTSGTFVRFYLRGCAGNQPRVNGTALIGPTQGAVWYKDFAANSTGNVSGTLYSTRDSAGTGAGDITCGTSSTSVWYGMVAFVGGRGGPEMPVHAKSGSTLDITQVTAITTNPVTTSPTGDSTYLRLDAGNSPVTGNLETKGQNILNAYKLNSELVIDGCNSDVPSPKYACTATGINSAITDANTAGGGVVRIPPATITLSTAIAMKSKVALKCSANFGTVLTQDVTSYTGTVLDYATNNAYNSSVEGCNFDGGFTAQTQVAGSFQGQNGAPSLAHVTALGIDMRGTGWGNWFIHNRVQFFFNSTATMAVGGTGNENVVMENQFVTNMGSATIPVLAVQGSGGQGNNQIQNNIFSQFGGQAINVDNGANIVSGNRLAGDVVTAHVTVSGTTITYVSGPGEFGEPSFFRVIPGHVVEMASGACSVATVTSTSITCYTAPGNVTNVAAIIGNPNVEEVAGNSGAGATNSIVGNNIYGAVLDCILVDAQAQYNQIQENSINSCGQSAVRLDGTSTLGNQITGNSIQLTSLLPSTGFTMGIVVRGSASSNYVGQNLIYGASPMANPVSFAGSGAGNILGDNYYPGSWVTSSFPISTTSNKVGTFCGTSIINPVVGNAFGVTTLGFPVTITRITGVITSLGVGGSGNVTVSVSEASHTNPLDVTVAVNSAVNTVFTATGSVNHAASTQLSIFIQADNETTRSAMSVCAEYEAQ